MPKLKMLARWRNGWKDCEELNDIRMVDNRERWNQHKLCTIKQLLDRKGRIFHQNFGRAWILDLLFLSQLLSQHSGRIRRFHYLERDVNHVKPSYKPSPVVAHDGWMYQFRSRMPTKFSCSWISYGSMATNID